MKKGLALLLVGAMCTGIFTGCGSNTGTGGKSSEVSASTESKKGEVLTMMLNGAASDAYVAGYQKLIENFNKSNDYGVTIKPEFVSNSDYKTKLTTMMASDSEPDIIFTWELGYLQKFVDGGKIVDLQKYLDKDTTWANSFNKGTLVQETYNKDVYGIPTAQCIATMYYNKAIFQQYNLKVPTTYDEYKTVCDTLLKNGITPVALASTADDAWLVSQYIQQLSDGIAGYDLFDGIKNGTRKWNDDAMVQAASTFQKEVNEGYFEKGFTGVSGSEAEALFQTGKAAMYFNGTWEISNLDNANTCQVAKDVSCFTMPAVNANASKVSVGSLDNSFAVTTKCKNVDAAVALLKYWTNKENAQTLLYDYGRMPATSIDVDQSKLSSLSKDALTCFNEQTALTPWFDRMNTDLGNEFNNSSVAIANGDDVKTTLNKLQDYADNNKK